MSKRHIEAHSISYLLETWTVLLLREKNTPHTAVALVGHPSAAAYAKY